MLEILNKRIFPKAKVIEVIAFAVVFAAFIITLLLLTSALGSAVKKEEARECLQWEKWSKEIKVFYLTPWQKEQCDAVGIKIDAPIKKGD